MQVVKAGFVFCHLGDKDVGSSGFFHEDVHDDCVGYGAMVFLHFCEDHVSFVVSDWKCAASYVAGYVIGDEQLAVVMEVVLRRVNLREVERWHGILHFFLFHLFLARFQGVVVLV